MSVGQFVQVAEAAGGGFVLSLPSGSDDAEPEWVDAGYLKLQDDGRVAAALTRAGALELVDEIRDEGDLRAELTEMSEAIGFYLSQFLLVDIEAFEVFEFRIDTEIMQRITTAIPKVVVIRLAWAG